MSSNGVISVAHDQTKKLTVPNISDGTQLQNWAISNGLPAASTGIETSQYRQILCNAVEKRNIAAERENNRK